MYPINPKGKKAVTKFEQYNSHGWEKRGPLSRNRLNSMHNFSKGDWQVTAKKHRGIFQNNNDSFSPNRMRLQITLNNGTPKVPPIANFGFLGEPPMAHPWLHRKRRKSFPLMMRMIKIKKACHTNKYTNIQEFHRK